MKKFITGFRERLKEPSSIAGLGLVVAGAGQLFQINEAPAVADVANQVSASGDWKTGLAVLIAGVLSFLMKEKITTK